MVDNVGGLLAPLVGPRTVGTVRTVDTLLVTLRRVSFQAEIVRS